MPLRATGYFVSWYTRKHLKVTKSIYEREEDQAREELYIMHIIHHFITTSTRLSSRPILLRLLGARNHVKSTLYRTRGINIYILK